VEKTQDEWFISIYDEIEYCPQFAVEINFLDWYENWLDSIISGQRFDHRQAYRINVLKDMQMSKTCIKIIYYIGK